MTPEQKEGEGWGFCSLFLATESQTPVIPSERTQCASEGPALGALRAEVVGAGAHELGWCPTCYGLPPGGARRARPEVEKTQRY